RPQANDPFVHSSQQSTCIEGLISYDGPWRGVMWA
ncbi:MAG: hypothetical protein QOG10_2840, partial [Kribbellaceae bacterium]|nr:hypothetical protein [Kribbellaceae bacterium]